MLEKASTDGVFQALSAVSHKLNEPIPLGYCNVGTVVSVGSNVVGFAEGDRVVSNGPHAELVVVPKHLCCKIPSSVTDESASFTV